MQRRINGVDTVGEAYSRGWKKSRGSGGGGSQGNEASVVQGVCEALLSLSQVSPGSRRHSGDEVIIDVPIEKLPDTAVSARACGDIVVQATSPQSSGLVEASAPGTRGRAKAQGGEAAGHGHRPLCRSRWESDPMDVETRSEDMKIDEIERPVGPVNNHAASFEASCAAIAGMMDSGRLDKEYVAIMRDGIEFFFAMSREDFAGRDLLRVLREASGDARSSVSPGSAPRMMNRSQSMWIERTPGFTWATEILSTPNAYTLFFCFVDFKFQVTCNDLMSRLFLGADEIYRSASDLRSTHVHMLADVIVPRFIEKFYRAIYESCFSRGSGERQTIIQLRDRSGNLVRCLTTIRTHWHEGTAALAVRFWPFSSLLEWSSDTDQAWF